MNILPIEPGHPLWARVIEYAGQCSWRAGPYLASAMRSGALTGWERVFAASEAGEVCGYCTLTRADCIPDVPCTPWIGFVFVGEPHRGKRLSQRLIQCALGYAKGLGFSTVYIASREQGLYEKYGFDKLEDRMDDSGGEEQLFTISI